MTELNKSIIQKVKDELEITDDLSSTELYDLLHRYRSSQHPDKFTDDKRKEEAEEKFKNLNTLLQELASYIETEKLQKKPSEIIPFQKDFDLVKSKQANVNLEETINRLELTIRVNEITIRDLKRELARLRSEKVDKKTKELIKLYKPTKKNLFALGITFFLTFIIGILTKIEEIATIISKYFPFNEKILNYIIFGILVLIPMKYMKMVYEESRIQKLSNKIKTPLFINKFYQYLKNNDITESFAEINVYDFLTNQLIPKNKIIKFINSKVFHLYSEITIDSLKDIFIYNLINKQLINISTAEKLDRTFRIVKGYNHRDFDDFDDLDF